MTYRNVCIQLICPNMCKYTECSVYNKVGTDSIKHRCTRYHWRYEGKRQKNNDKPGLQRMLTIGRNGIICCVRHKILKER